MKGNLWKYRLKNVRERIYYSKAVEGMKGWLKGCGVMGI